MNYGLYVGYKDDLTIQKSGRLSWRGIIKKSQKYIVDYNIFFIPIYYKKAPRSELTPKSWTNKPTKGGQFFNDKIQNRI